MISEKNLEFHLPGGSPQPHICSSTNQKHPAGFGARQGWVLWVGAAPVDVEQEGRWRRDGRGFALPSWPGAVTSSAPAPSVSLCWASVATAVAVVHSCQGYKTACQI